MHILNYTVHLLDNTFFIFVYFYVTSLEKKTLNPAIPQNDTQRQMC